MSNELTTTETRRLAELEKVIETGQAAFVAVGEALGEIRDSKLYRSTHKTFDAYLRERWGYKRSYAYELIDASRATQDLSGIPDKPTAVSQAKELAKAPKAERASVWKEAVESAPKGKDGKPKVTAKEVQRVVASRTEPKPESQPAPPAPKISPTAPPPAGDPFDQYNARLLDLADQARDLREAFLALARDKDEAMVYAGWINEKEWRGWFDSFITTITMHRVTELLLPSEAAQMPDGGRPWAYARDGELLKRIRKGRAA